MADVKISGLPASTVPLAGTEVLPIVQGGTTKQVSIANVTAGRSVAALSVITPTIQAEAGSAGGTIKNGSGVAQMQWGSGGGSNLSLEVATNINPANAAVSIAPTGTGTVTINPATASNMNNVAIGGTTPLAGKFTALEATGVTTVQAGTAADPAITTTGDTNTGIFFPAADTIAFSEGGAEAMRIDGSGNVGIGTSSPAAKLDAQQSTTDMVGLSILNTNSSIGTTTSSQLRMGITNSVGASYAVIKCQEQSNDDYPAITFGVQNAATTNPTERMRIDFSGIVTMSAYGAGAATFSAAGVISSVSDETWKVKDGVPVDPDAMLNKLEPGYWFYNDKKAPIFGSDRQLGFYAQNVNAAIGPEAAPIPEEGKPWGYYDRSVLAITVMSLQKALATIETLNARIIALETAQPNLVQN
jgi:hypothetical protein